MDGALDDRPKLTVVVPCYNEAPFILDTIDQVAAAAAESKIAAFEILVIDDCSKDESPALVAKRAKTQSFVKLVRNARNLGFGGAYKEGVRRASGEYVIIVPGDNCFPSRSIAGVLGKLGTADIVIPFTVNPETRPWRRRALSRGFTMLVNALFGLRVPYYNGIVLHRTALLRTIEIRTDSFAFQAEALVKLIRQGASYETVGIELKESPQKATSAFRLRNVLRVLKSLCSIWYEVNFLPKARPSP